MCFSATGSFIAAGLNAAAGIAALSRVSAGRESLLAGFPILFGAQQAVEGALWLALPAHADIAAPLANLFAFIALVIWPALVPVTVLLLEPQPARRAALRWLLLGGIAFAAFQAFGILGHPYAARIVGHSIAYANGVAFPYGESALYGLCTCVPLLASSERTLRLLGLCVVVGLGVSFAFFYLTFFSVWCSFAALASGLIFFRAFFELPRLRPFGAASG